jgi:hypothetical protein
MMGFFFVLGVLEENIETRVGVLKKRREEEEER